MNTRKRTIRYKIIMGFCLLCVSFITIALLFLHRYYIDSSMQYLKANLNELGMAASSQIDTHFEEMDSVAKMTMSQDSFTESFLIFAEHPEDQDNNKKLLKIMTDAYKNRNNIRRVAAINTKGDFLSTGITAPDKAVCEEVLEYAVQEGGGTAASLYFPLRKDYMDHHSDTGVFTCISPVRQDSQVLGYIIVQQNEMYYNNAIHLQLDHYNVETIIIWKDSHVLYSSCEQALTAQYIENCQGYASECETETDLFDIEMSDHRNIKYIFSISKSASSSRLRGFFGVFILIMLMFAGSSVLFIIFFVGQMTRPMSKIVKHMSEWNIEEEQSGQINVKTTDYETEVLLKTYKEMISRQNETLDANKKLELLQERTLFSALQSEISPHFLFNTLDGLAEMCEEEGAYETADCCYSLADILRYASSYATEEVLLSQEIENLEAYLRLMKVRYRSRIEYVIDVENKCKFLYLPKLTLQPLVENAIKYSIAEQDCVKIEIRAYFHEDSIFLSVCDNGPGITKEAIQKAGQRMEKISSKKEFQEVLESIQIGNMGLTGTLIRLKLFYKEHFEYELQNKDKGMNILLKIQYHDFI